MSEVVGMRADIYRLSATRIVTIQFGKSMVPEIGDCQSTLGAPTSLLVAEADTSCAGTVITKA
jgi:hypothetical protein